MLPTMRTASNGWRQEGSVCARRTDTLARSHASTNARFMAANYMLRLPFESDRAMMTLPMSIMNRCGSPLKGRDLISLAQQLARDAERHAILSASLASQADRLMVAGLRLLEPRPMPVRDTRPRP